MIKKDIKMSCPEEAIYNVKVESRSFVSIPRYAKV